MEKREKNINFKKRDAPKKYIVKENMNTFYCNNSKQKNSQYFQK